jgi:hypothetical protein
MGDRNFSRSKRPGKASPPCTDGLGGYQIDDPEWQAAADKLIQAALYPSGERTVEAREALLKIAAEPSSAKLDA